MSHGVTPVLCFCCYSPLGAGFDGQGSGGVQNCLTAAAGAPTLKLHSTDGVCEANFFLLCRHQLVCSHVLAFTTHESTDAVCWLAPSSQGFIRGVGDSGNRCPQGFGH